MLTFIVFIILFTVVYGRLFCGWVCPQTIFMEMVFRKIEYKIEGDANAQRKLNNAPWTKSKIKKKGLKHFFFILISILIAHTFLSYIVGLDRVTEIVTSSPAQNLGGFIAMVVFTGVFYFVFSVMREQVCTTICPYGRLQGVLTDKNTILVSYDFMRGEPRGKIKKQRKSKQAIAKSDCKTACNKCNNGQPCPTENLVQQMNTLATTLPASPKKKGDCVDCKLCVKVCPTGIDIRDGVQLECINCTACMDACDEVMTKVGRSTGLIRYDSLNGIQEKKRKIFTPRVIAYTLLLAVLMIVNIAMLGNQSDIETIILRTPGMLYQKVGETHISNLYDYQIFNKTNEPLSLTFQLREEEGTIKLVGKHPEVPRVGMVEGAFFIEIPRKQLSGRKNKITIDVYAGDTLLETTSTNFFGPK